jgi:hypothetical protein
MRWKPSGLPVRTTTLALALALGCACAGARRAAGSRSADLSGLERELAGFLDGPRARLLILGTFHFADAGLDEYKPVRRFDPSSEERRREIAEVVERLAAFRPTKVAVEWPKEQQDDADRLYAAFRGGERRDDPNEVSQLGFRLAERMGHERVWLVDVQGRHYEPPIDRQAIAKSWGEEARLDSRWWPAYERLAAWTDELKTRIPLLEQLLLLGSETALRASHGQYLIGGFQLVRGDEYPGPDHLAGWWYDRNLRIFANVQALIESPEERIVLIIGQGHAPILRHAAQASPEVELVEVREVLGD